MLALDHLVYAVHDADAARLKFTAQEELVAYQGGKHENWGTYNYLSQFNNQCYIEWLSLFDEAKASQSDNPLIRQTADTLKNGREGLIQLAFRTDRINLYLEYYRQQGLPFHGPFEGSRRKPDDSLLAWQMVFPTSPDGLLLPFLIEWNEAPPVPENPALINKEKIHTVRFGTHDPESARQTWMEMFQLPAPGPQNPFTWQLDNTDISLTHGDHIDYKTSL